MTTIQRYPLSLVLCILLVFAKDVRSNTEQVSPCMPPPMDYNVMELTKAADYEEYIDNANPIHIAVCDDIGYEIIHNVQMTSKRNLEVVFYLYVNNALYYIGTVFSDHEVLKEQLKVHSHYFVKDFYAVAMCMDKMWLIEKLIVINSEISYANYNDGYSDISYYNIGDSYDVDGNYINCCTNSQKNHDLSYVCPYGCYTMTNDNNNNMTERYAKLVKTLKENGNVAYNCSCLIKPCNYGYSTAAVITNTFKNGDTETVPLNVDSFDTANPHYDLEMYDNNNMLISHQLDNMYKVNAENKHKNIGIGLVPHYDSNLKYTYFETPEQIKVPNVLGNFNQFINTAPLDIDSKLLTSPEPEAASEPVQILSDTPTTEMSNDLGPTVYDISNKVLDMSNPDLIDISNSCLNKAESNVNDVMHQYFPSSEWELHDGSYNIKPCQGKIMQQYPSTAEATLNKRLFQYLPTSYTLSNPGNDDSKYMNRALFNYLQPSVEYSGANNFGKETVKSRPEFDDYSLPNCRLVESKTNHIPEVATIRNPMAYKITSQPFLPIPEDLTPTELKLNQAFQNHRPSEPLSQQTLFQELLDQTSSQYTEHKNVQRKMPPQLFRPADISLNRNSAQDLQSTNLLMEKTSPQNLRSSDQLPELMRSQYFRPTNVLQDQNPAQEFWRSDFLTEQTIPQDIQSENIHLPQTSAQYFKPILLDQHSNPDFLLEQMSPQNLRPTDPRLAMGLLQNPPTSEMRVEPTSFQNFRVPGYAYYEQNWLQNLSPASPADLELSKSLLHNWLPRKIPSTQFPPQHMSLEYPKLETLPQDLTLKEIPLGDAWHQYLPHANIIHEPIVNDMSSLQKTDMNDVLHNFSASLNKDYASNNPSEISNQYTSDFIPDSISQDNLIPVKQEVNGINNQQPRPVRWSDSKTKTIENIGRYQTSAKSKLKEAPNKSFIYEINMNPNEGSVDDDTYFTPLNFERNQYEDKYCTPKDLSSTPGGLGYPNHNYVPAELINKHVNPNINLRQFYAPVREQNLFFCEDYKPSGVSFNDQDQKYFIPDSKPNENIYQSENKDLFEKFSPTEHEINEETVRNFKSAQLFPSKLNQPYLEQYYIHADLNTQKQNKNTRREKSFGEPYLKQDMPQYLTTIPEQPSQGSSNYCTPSKSEFKLNKYLTPSNIESVKYFSPKQWRYFTTTQYSDPIGPTPVQYWWPTGVIGREHLSKEPTTDKYFPPQEPISEHYFRHEKSVPEGYLTPKVQTTDAYLTPGNLQNEYSTVTEPITDSTPVDLISNLNMVEPIPQTSSPPIKSISEQYSGLAQRSMPGEANQIQNFLPVVSENCRSPLKSTTTQYSGRVKPNLEKFSPLIKSAQGQYIVSTVKTPELLSIPSTKIPKDYLLPVLDEYLQPELMEARTLTPNQYATSLNHNPFLPEQYMSLIKQNQKQSLTPKEINRIQYSTADITNLSPGFYQPFRPPKHMQSLLQHSKSETQDLLCNPEHDTYPYFTQVLANPKQDAVKFLTAEDINTKQELQLNLSPAAENSAAEHSLTQYPITESATTQQNSQHTLTPIESNLNQEELIETPFSEQSISQCFTPTKSNSKQDVLNYSTPDLSPGELNSKPDLWPYLRPEGSKLEQSLFPGSITISPDAAHCLWQHLTPVEPNTRQEWLQYLTPTQFNSRQGVQQYSTPMAGNADLLSYLTPDRYIKDTISSDNKLQELDYLGQMKGISTSFQPEQTSPYLSTEGVPPLETSYAFDAVNANTSNHFCNLDSLGSSPSVFKNVYDPNRLDYQSTKRSYLFNQLPPKSEINTVNSNLTCFKSSVINYINSNKFKNDMFNNFKDHREIALGDIGVAKYDPIDKKYFTVGTTTDDINLRAWYSKLKLMKVKLTFEPAEVEVLNFLPIVKNKSNYDPKCITAIAKNAITQRYGEPLEVNGVYSLQYPYAVVDVGDFRDSYVLLWPTFCDCGCMKSGCKCFWDNITNSNVY